MPTSQETTRDWPSLAIGLFDALTGRQAEITYEFDDFAVSVPSRVGENAESAQWNVSGTLRVRTRDNAS